MVRIPLGVVLLLAMLAMAAPARAAVDLSDADRAWEERAEGARDGRPRSEPILRSIEGYRAALEADPERLEVRWKLLRSLHFAGAFLAREEAESRGWFERGTAVSERGLERLARALGLEDGREGLDALEPDVLEARIREASLPVQDVARCYFWSAIHWGDWSRTVGLLAAVREGVANRLHRYTRVVIHLEPGYEEGGAFRLLGRLHAVLPRIPFLSGWVDRERALPLVEQARDLAPENPGNRLLLALTLLDVAPQREDEARRLLRQVADLSPRPSMRIEDLEIRREARQRLDEL